MDPQVSLGAFQRLMAHHLLDVKNRAPLLEQLMGKGMPKAVGALRKARPAHAGADLFRNPVGGKGADRLSGEGTRPVRLPWAGHTARRP